MTVSRKVTGTAVSMPRGLLIGNTISIALTVLLAGILAKLVSTEKLEWAQIGYGIMVLLFVASATGTIAAVKAIKRQRLAVCLLAGVIYWLTLMAITALFLEDSTTALRPQEPPYWLAAAPCACWESGKKEAQTASGAGGDADNNSLRRGG